MSWSRAMTLRGPEFLAAWHALELGEPPVELRSRSPGRTVDEREVIFARELARLRERGLAAMDATGIRPRARLTQALRLLADAPLVHDLRLSTGLVALGAIDGEDGVVLVSDDRLRLLEVPGPMVSAALVELIGPMRTGRCRTVNLDGDTLDRARALVHDGSVWTLADRLVELGTPRIDAHSLARMCTGVTAYGQVGALARGGGAEGRAPARGGGAEGRGAEGRAPARGGGAERRGRWVVGFHRTPTGDFLQLRKPSASGRPHVTIAPVTAAGLRGHLSDLAGDLRNVRAAS